MLKTNPLNIKRIHAEISGRVQGVGFRPTVYRHAMALKLSGYVRNTPSGVVIEAEGDVAVVDRFVAQLQAEPPRQARIEALQVSDMPVSGLQAPFEIKVSGRSGDCRSGDLQAGMPPDLATCPDCRAELFDVANRRFWYPFINCTNCGPRFTIIRELPYDREQTSMAEFRLCPECKQEFEDPANRRFDAQPNACAVCGPRVELQMQNAECRMFSRRKTACPPKPWRRRDGRRRTDARRQTPDGRRRTEEDADDWKQNRGHRPRLQRSNLTML